MRISDWYFFIAFFLLCFAAYLVCCKHSLRADAALDDLYNVSPAPSKFRVWLCKTHKHRGHYAETITIYYGVRKVRCTHCGVTYLKEIIKGFQKKNNVKDLT